MPANSFASAWFLIACIAAPCVAQGRISTDTIEPRFSYRLDEVAAAAGILPLRAPEGLAGALREVRLWAGFGMYSPEHLLRVIESASGVHGVHLFWWTPNQHEDELAFDRDSTRISNRELYEHLRAAYQCGPRRRQGDYEFCTSVTPGAGTWVQMLGRLDSLGVTTLPDAASLTPPGLTGFDGTSLVVEVRDSARYRTYSYWEPEEAADQVEIRRAAAILTIVFGAGARE